MVNKKSSLIDVPDYASKTLKIVTLSKVYIGMPGKVDLVEEHPNNIPIPYPKTTQKKNGSKILRDKKNLFCKEIIDFKVNFDLYPLNRVIFRHKDLAISRFIQKSKKKVCFVDIEALRSKKERYVIIYFLDIRREIVSFLEQKIAKDDACWEDVLLIRDWFEFDNTSTFEKYLEKKAVFLNSINLDEYIVSLNKETEEKRKKEW